jgi:hypothetical protein
MKHRKFAFFLVLTLLFGGCAVIPKEASVLSEELGNRLTSIQKSHITLLHSFFDQKRDLVDEFITEKWVPVFAKEIFNNKTIQDTWKEVVASNNDEDKLKFVVILGPKIQDQINKKRIDLIKPLDDLEKEIEYKIRNEYEMARSINNSLTSFLLSASKVDENRSRYLSMLGIKDESIDKMLTETDDIVSQLVSIGETAISKEDQARSYIEKIKELKKNINP